MANKDLKKKIRKKAKNQLEKKLLHNKHIKKVVKKAGY